MNDAKQQLLDKLKAANNILVTVSRDPSVDQLSACLALTLALNKLGKHGTAVFSGAVPSNLEFLQPEKTLEKNTDSLRDFIIALDKSKADKLRYKVEDDVVRIFITPYKTSISDADLEFSQGDFNVDVVVALGVQRQEDLDEAIVAHGRILHDATVTSITLSTEQGLGSINWQDPSASSLGELTTELLRDLGPNLLDDQIATALLTGIVAETDRFSNQKTTPIAMSLSATLMAAGANQQLVASELQAPAAQPVEEHEDHPDDHDDHEDHPDDQPEQPEEPPKPDGELDIEHENDEPEQTNENDVEHHDDQQEHHDPNQDGDDQKSESGSEPEPEAKPEVESESSEDEHHNDEKTNEPAPEEEPLSVDHLSAGSKRITEPPSLGGMLTANTQPEGLDPSIDPLGTSAQGSNEQLLSHDQPAADPVQLPTPSFASEPLIPGLTPPPPAWVPPSDDPFNLAATSSETLSEIEAEVHSTHLEPTQEPETGLDAARDEVFKALNDASGPDPAPAPIQALNAQPFGGDLHPTDADATIDLPSPAPAPSFDPLQPYVPANDQPPAGPVTDNPSHNFTDVMQDQIPTMPTPQTMPMPTDQSFQAAPAPQVVDPNAPPPVPPPIPFQFGAPPQ